MPTDKSTEPGLCSITVRQLGVDEVVDLAARSGLAAIEWGADVHVPPGDLAAAQHVAEAGAAAGIASPSYGSYLFGEESGDDIAKVFDTALALGAENVRVWTPFGSEPGCDDGRRAQITGGVAAMAAAGAERGLTVGLEYHVGTLTATSASTLRLLRDVDNPALFTYWQPY